MEAKQLSETLTVAPQILAEHVKPIADHGYKSIMCNRPDDEEAGQPAFAEIEEAANAAGLEVRYVPAVSGALTAENVADFAKALDELPKPIFAYCRSGARCQMLWQMAESS